MGVIAGQGIHLPGHLPAGNSGRASERPERLDRTRNAFTTYSYVGAVSRETALGLRGPRLAGPSTRPGQPGSWRKSREAAMRPPSKGVSSMRLRLPSACGR